MSSHLFERHAETLRQAVAAIHERGYWSAFPEVPSGKIYGESAKADGARAFESRLESRFELDQPGCEGWLGSETSPYGIPLGISYPSMDLNVLLPAAQQATGSWSRAGVNERTGICLEILSRLNRRSFEMANAVMHTTGQGFAMAFQAGGPHAQDRGLEAIAYAWRLMSHVPDRVSWEKQISKTHVVRLEKTYRIVPRGLSLVIGCSTFPTWNAYPGLFANLVTGNAVVVKPSPTAVLPLAITVETAREVFRECGFDPNVVTLVVDEPKAPVTKQLATRPELSIIDFTGGSDFGTWLEQNARHVQLFTEKSGVNSVILDSVEDLRAMADNLAFSISLYSGQMCTKVQNIFVPCEGIAAGSARIGFEQVAHSLVEAVDRLLEDPSRAADVLGCIQSEKTLARITEARANGGALLRASESVSIEKYPRARVRSPLMLRVRAEDEPLFSREMFGPIIYVIETHGSAHSLALAKRLARERGAITWAVYATRKEVLAEAESAALSAGVPLSCNLTGPVWVNQAAAFSDYHVTGANPAGNATFCDEAFVAPRFRIIQTRRPSRTA
ncbi:MAG: phenylacetic acid degradation protein PaaN [Acidobacteriota bacterium]|nr:MAG: phenylacetic acid degradation protein PaaN [Acidobacteriota bacterium]